MNDAVIEPINKDRADKHWVENRIIKTILEEKHDAELEFLMEMDESEFEEQVSLAEDDNNAGDGRSWSAITTLNAVREALGDKPLSVEELREDRNSSS